MNRSPGAKVVHSVPGRLRVRFGRFEGGAGEPDALLARLRGRAGVRAARFNPASGSIVVEYDAAVLTEAALIGDLPAVAPTLTPALTITADSSPAARAFSQSWWEMNAALARATGGRVDLKLLVPLALVLVALRQLLRQGDLQAAPWHALLWYSYNLFYQFHPEMRNPASG